VARWVSQSARVLEEGAERLAGVLVDLAPALDQEHGHVQRPLHVLAVSEAVRPREREQTGAVGVHAEPHAGPPASLAGRPALGEGAVGEHRRDDGLDAERDAQLAGGVLLVRVVEVRLHRGRAAHHVERAWTAGGEILPHDPIAQLGHPGQIRVACEGVEADPEPRDAELGRDVAELRHVRAQLGACQVDGLLRRAGQLELAPGLERDVRGAARQGDDRPSVVLSLGEPAVALHEVSEDAGDAARSLEGQRSAVVQHAELLGFRPDSPARTRLFGFVEGLEEIVETPERIVGAAGHGVWVRAVGGERYHGRLGRSSTEVQET